MNSQVEADSHVKWVGIIMTILLIAASTALAHLLSENARLEAKLEKFVDESQSLVDLKIKLSECSQTLYFYQHLKGELENGLINKDGNNCNDALVLRGDCLCWGSNSQLLSSRTDRYLRADGRTYRPLKD